MCVQASVDLSDPTEFTQCPIIFSKVQSFLACMHEYIASIPSHEFIQKLLIRNQYMYNIHCTPIHLKISERGVEHIRSYVCEHISTGCSDLVWELRISASQDRRNVREHPIVMWLKECSTYLSVSDVFAVVFDVILGHVVELLLLPGPAVPHCQHINS